MARCLLCSLQAYELLHFLKKIEIKIFLPFPGCFMDDVLVIVVSETSRQLLIVHLWFVLPQPPSPGHLIWIRQFELPAISSPGDEVLTRLVCQQLQQELPQLDGT